MPLLALPCPWSRPVAYGVAVCLSLPAGGCGDGPGSPFDPLEAGGDASVERQVAESWVGWWDGAGTVRSPGSDTLARDLRMRITFDADSLRRADCPHCLTLSLDPWFSAGNLPFTAAASASATYTKDGIQRSLAIQRFSGAGGTANTLLVTLRHERSDGAGRETLLHADLEFVRR